jgi:hypothetical protein
MPLVFGLMAGTMGGIHWIIRRRQELAAENVESAEEAQTSSEEEER